MKRETGEGVAFALAVIVLLACAVASYHSLGGVKWFIDDKDPQSYVAVVLLMVAFQLIFFFVGEMRPRPDAHGAAAALALYALAAAVFAFLPLEMSLGFWYVRMDLLALAFFFVGSIALVFGSETLWRLRWLALYSLLACPLLAAPAISLEPALTGATADAAQGFASVLGLPVQRAPGNILTTPLSDTAITIAPACAALAATLSLIAFLLPLAYLLKGNAWKRLGWLVAGTVLIIVLNFVRIFTVIYLWQSNGIGSALSFFQSFGGNVLFNLAILAMILSFPLFGLGLPRIRGTSIVSGRLNRAWKEFAADARSLGQPQVAALAVFIIAAGGFSLLDGKVADYSWLQQYEGANFSAEQANPAELPYPDEWDFLGSQTGFSENYTVTRMVFDLNDTQIQAAVFSSGNRTTLDFSAEDELSAEGYYIEGVQKAQLGKGIGAEIVAYSKEGKNYSTLYWTQPAKMGGKSTYAAFLFTVADPARNESSWLTESGRRFVSQLGP